MIENDDIEQLLSYPLGEIGNRLQEALYVIDSLDSYSLEDGKPTLRKTVQMTSSVIEEMKDVFEVIQELSCKYEKCKDKLRRERTEK